MANYWAIAIGINQYRCFQPLLYAQRDAQALWNYWVTDGGFTLDHCALLTDISTVADQDFTEPNRENIERAIAHVCQQLKPDDFLWCFFSGYGIRVQEQDYLMPIEGDPTQAPATGIPVEFLFDQFQAAATKNIFLVLDINRSQGILGSEGVGKQIITLAHHYSISTILSCGPDQFSHETLALRQGLFTAALLEGLRFYGCTTLAQLAQYVSKRLPELSEHHWRPRQDPFVAIAPEQHHSFIVPPTSLAAVGSVSSKRLPLSSELSPTTHDAPASSTYQTVVGVSGQSSFMSANGHTLTNGTTASTPSSPLNGHSSNGKTLLDEVPNQSNTSTASSTLASSDLNDDSTDLFWRRTLPWIIGVLSLLILAVFIQNRNAFDQGLPRESSSSPASPNSTTPSGEGLPPASPADTTLPADTTAPTNSTTQFFAGTESSALSPSSLSPLPSTNVSGAGAIAIPGSSASPSPILDPSSGQSFSQARAALQAQNYRAAIQLLDQVPAEQRTNDYANLLLQANQGILAQAWASLARPRALTATNQASDFSIAIQQASQIKQGHPLYEDAQQSIDRWSQMILDLARSRANQPNRGSSLIAAQNYRAAIEAAGLVPANRSQSTVAQQFVAQWSQTIWQMATRRAIEGRLDVAIKTAEQIPRNAPTYGAAQQAIAQWQAQLGYPY